MSIVRTDHDAGRAKALAERGAYLTDGTRLYEVVEAAHGHLLLQDSRHLDHFPEWVCIREFNQRELRVVR